jgi:hypothetical protein
MFCCHALFSRAQRLAVAEILPKIRTRAPVAFRYGRLPIRGAQKRDGRASPAIGFALSTEPS